MKHMNYEFQQTNLSRSLLAGLLAGLISVALNMTIIFCFGTSGIGSRYSVIINPFTIFLGGIIPTIFGGIVYSFFSGIKSRNVMYAVIFGVLTFLCAKSTYHIHLINDSGVEKPFHQILVSMIIVAGLCTTFIIPVIINNKKLQQTLF
jgi:hypothetical protein